jgi:putative endonuclease
MEKTKVGEIGEDIAAKYLSASKYSILARNHKERFDEIDIVARHPGGSLIFCEVKTSNQLNDFFGGFMPEDNLSQIKRKKMIRGAHVFLARHPGLVWEPAGWQLDLIAIVLKRGDFFELRHYESI